jgi:hypothetical protein
VWPRIKARKLSFAEPKFAVGANENATSVLENVDQAEPGAPDGLRAACMNDDLGLCGLVENQIGIRRRCHPTKSRIVRAAADVGMQQQ